MSEICGGKAENFYELIEKNLTKTIEELIALYFEKS